MFMRILPALFIVYQNIQINLIFSLYILSFDLHVFLTALTIYMVLQGMFFSNSVTQSPHRPESCAKTIH